MPVKTKRPVKTNLTGLFPASAAAFIPAQKAPGNKSLLGGAWIDARIHPGESFSFTWQVSSYNWPINLGNVHGELSYQGTSIYTTKSVPFVVVKGSGDTQSQTETNVTLPNNQALRDALYKVGDHDLDLRFSGDGPDWTEGLLSGTFSLGVDGFPTDGYQAFPPLFSIDLVNFSPDQFVWGAQWNRKCAIRFGFTNSSKTANTKFTGNLEVVDYGQGDQPGAKSSPKMIATPFLAPGESVTITVSPIVHYWLWWIPGLWLTIGPTWKHYVYSVMATAEDEFGNKTDVSLPDVFNVRVDVEEWKWIMMLSAAATGTVGVTMMSSGFWPFMAAGAALITISIGLAIAASDPPEPDPLYLEPVVVTPAAVKPELKTIPGIAPWASLVEAMGRILAGRSALGEIEGRLLGARRDGNSTGVKLQTKGYRETLRYMVSASAQLRRAVSESLQTLSGKESSLLFNQKELQKALRRLQRQGLSTETRKKLKDAGVAKDVIQTVARVVKNRKVVERAAAVGLSDSLAVVASALTRLVDKSRREAEAILTPPMQTSPPVTGGRHIEVAWTTEKKRG